MEARVEEAIDGLIVMEVLVNNVGHIGHFDAAIPGFVWQNPHGWPHVALALTLYSPHRQIGISVSLKGFQHCSCPLPTTINVLAN